MSSIPTCSTGSRFVAAAALLALSASCGSGWDSTGAAIPLGDPAQICVDTINQYRAGVGLPAYTEVTAQEPCANGQAMSDAASATVHGALRACGELAQNECPGWPGPPARMITSCLQTMWDAGPGTGPTHEPYVTMRSTAYTKVACGFVTLSDGSVWAVQDFFSLTVSDAPLADRPQWPFRAVSRQGLRRGKSRATPDFLA